MRRSRSGTLFEKGHAAVGCDLPVNAHAGFLSYSDRLGIELVIVTVSCAGPLVAIKPPTPGSALLEFSKAPGVRLITTFTDIAAANVSVGMIVRTAFDLYDPVERCLTFRPEKISVGESP